MPDHTNYAPMPESPMTDATMPEELAGIPPAAINLHAAAGPDDDKASAIPGGIDGNGAPDFIRPLEEVERQAIEAAIRACAGNIPRAAALLQISPSTIYRKKSTWEMRPGPIAQGNPGKRA